MRKIFKKRITHGATLAEVLVYVFIMGLLLSVVVGSLFSLSRSYKIIKSSSAIDSTAQVSLERMTREIRGALSVDDSQSVFNSSPGRLILNSLDLSGNPKTVEFFVEDGVLKIRENGIEIGPLSSTFSTITNLVFTDISTAQSEAVKIEMTVQSGQGESFRQKNFYSTIVLRGSYAP